MRKVYICLLAGMLGACSSGVNGERVWGMPESPAWFATASPETIRAYYEKFCIAYGYKPDTTDMDNCIINEAGNRRVSGTSASSSIQKISDGSSERRAEIRRRSNESLQKTFERLKNY